MNRRFRINIILFIAVIILSVYVSLPEKETQKEITRLSNINSASITHIEIIREDVENLIFQKKSDDWYMQSPLQYKANMSRINVILRLLQIETHGTLNSSDIDLARLELAKPKVTLKLNEHEFQFGNTESIDKRRYILFQNRIYMINDFLYPQLMTNAAFFVNSRLFEENTEITAIVFPENHIEKKNGQWKVEKPIKNMDPEKLVYNWKNATAISVSRYKDPEVKSFIQVTTDNNETKTFVIVRTDPYLILGRKDIGIQYHMGSDEAEGLLLPDNKSSDK